MSRLLLVPAAVVLAAAVVLGLLLGAPRSWHLPLDTPEAERFVYGFEPPEASPAGTFRWSGPDARLLAQGSSSGPALITLRLNGDWLNAQQQPELRLERAPQTFAAFKLLPGWRMYRALLPAGATATPDGQALPLHLTSATAMPGARTEGRDHRALGVPLAALHLATLAAPRDALADATARGLRLGWLLAVVVGGALALDLALLPRRRTGAWRRATVLALVLGTALVLAARADPVSFAWALPPTPWVLGLLSVGLGGAAVVTVNRARPVRPALGGIGLGLLACGQLLLHLQTAVATGLALALVGLMVLLAAGLGANGWQGLGTTWPAVPHRTARLLLVMVVAVALGMRLWSLDTLPFGLWRDEARHGLLALRMLEEPTFRPIYIAAERVNMPALGLYPFAAAFGLFGIKLWTMRVVTAVAGALTVLPLYGLTHRLLGRRDVALLTAALLAVASWHVAISRFAFPTVFDPLFGLTGLWLMLWALGPREQAARLFQRLGALTLAGACLGLAVQTYHTGRVVPVIAGGLLGLLALREPGARRLALVGGLALGLGFTLVLWPFIGYALAQPAAFNDRVSAVFVLSEAARKGQAPLSVLDQALRDHLLMFNVFGDQNARHHAPGRPLLDYLTGLGFLMGCAVVLRTVRDWRSLFLLAALGLSLAPSALAVDAPHAMRSFGAVAFACTLAALGWTALWGLLNRFGRGKTPLLGATLAAGSLLLNAWLYFGWMPPRPEVFTAFYPVQSQMGVYLRDVADREGVAAVGTLYVPQGLQGDPVFDLLTHGLAYQTFDGAQLSAPAPAGARFLVSGYFAAEETAALAPVLGPAATPEWVGPRFPDGRGPTFYVYRVP